MTTKHQKPTYTDDAIVPVHYLGDEDASVEWAEENKPISLFFDTKSYETFKRDDILYLFGRRGSGKTFFIRMLDYEVRNKVTPEYAVSSIVNQEDAYTELAIQLRGSPFNDLQQTELIYVLTKKWKWVLLLTAMKSVYLHYHDEYGNTEELKTIIEYLESEDVFETDPLKKINEIFTTELTEISYSPVKLALAINRIASRLGKPEKRCAEKALYKFLLDRHLTCLVMVDSIETYNINDTISHAVITALINAIYEMYLGKNKQRIIVKAAFASEMYNQFTIVNKGKTESKSIFILWQYKDLVCLLAKRIYHKLLEKEEESINLNSYSEAKHFLSKYISPTMDSRNDVHFDTLGYIFKHTQKKPRQIILLMNIILTWAYEHNGDPLKLDRLAITEGVHARLDMLVSGTLDIYGEIYDRGDRIIMAVLNNAPNYFTSSDLDKRIRNAKTVKGAATLPAADIKRLLFESGILGVERERRTLNSGKVVIEAVFEYQIKNILAEQNNVTYAVHPMVYQEFQIQLDLNSFVYPMPSEEEEKILFGIFNGDE